MAHTRAEGALRIAVAAALAAGCSAGGTSQSPPPSAPHTAAPSAADGTDVAACSDGECQVVVSGPVVIPVDAGLGVPAVEVVGLAPDHVAFSTPTSAGPSVTEAHPGCTVDYTPTGSSAGCGSSPEPQPTGGHDDEQQALHVLVRSAGAAHAVLELSVS